MILAVLQARFGSSRLPGKVLMPILGQPMLLRQIERVRRARRTDGLIVATSVDPADDGVAKAVRSAGIDVFRGPLNDVLERFYLAVRERKPDHVVRLTGDCPLADPAIIDQVVERHMDERNDYTSNCNPPTFPDGLDVEVFGFNVLERAWKEARLPSEREHVTPFMRVPGRFKTGNVENADDLSVLRWTVDEQDDFNFVTKVFQELYPATPDFGMADIVGLVNRNPLLGAMNRHERNEGYKASLMKDGKKDNV